MRNPDAIELLATNASAFALLFVIAFRAERKRGFNRYQLEPGEAFVGDWRNCGMTERQYRTAKRVLKKAGFATFKTTNKGTIARLADSRVFDVNIPASDEQNDRRATGERQAADDYQEGKECKKGKRARARAPRSKSLAPLQAWQLARDLRRARAQVSKLGAAAPEDVKASLAALEAEAARRGIDPDAERRAKTESRTPGTLNEGLEGQYADVGKITTA